MKKHGVRVKKILRRRLILVIFTVFVIALFAVVIVRGVKVAQEYLKVQQETVELQKSLGLGE